MIYEYAIEPGTLRGWAKNRRDFNDIMNNFGLGQPRFMSSLPFKKIWKKQMLKETSDLSTIERKRLDELFIHLWGKTIQRTTLNYDGEKSWLENAYIENSKKTFKAIIALTNPSQKTCVLSTENIDSWIGDNDNKFWGVEKNIVVKREAKAIAKALSSMLNNSTELIYIDPYFNPEKPRWFNVFSDVYKEFLKYKNDTETLRTEIHISAKKRIMSQEHFEKICRNKLIKLLNHRNELKIKCWLEHENGEKIHNRYILTDIGGVVFGTGLDEGGTNEKQENQTDDVSLMSGDTYRQRWHQYAGATPKFELESEFTIKK